MPGYSNLKNLLHDSAILVADATTGELLDAQDEAWASYMAAKKAYNEAYNEAYDKAYAKIEQQQREKKDAT